MQIVQRVTINNNALTKLLTTLKFEHRIGLKKYNLHVKKLSTFLELFYTNVHAKNSIWSYFVRALLLIAIL